MDERKKEHLIKAMELHGNEFVASLGKAWALADPQNSERLQKAFPEYVTRYSKMRIYSDKDDDLFEED